MATCRRFPVWWREKTVDEVESTLSGIRCGMKPTSCGDQLSKAVRAAYNAQQ